MLGFAVAIPTILSLRKKDGISRGAPFLRSNRRTARTARVHLPGGAIFVSVIVFPSLSTFPVTWIFAPFAASVVKFWFWMA